MQTFSNMRRNSTHKETLKAIALFTLIISYGALTDMLYYLPPLLGVAFVLFCRFMDKQQYHYLLPIVLFLLFFEATKGFFWLSAVLFFFLSYYLVIPRIRNLLGCEKCLVPIFVFYAYFGFYALVHIVVLFLGLHAPEFSWMLLYFALFETLFSVLLP